MNSPKKEEGTGSGWTSDGEREWACAKYAVSYAIGRLGVSFSLYHSVVSYHAGGSILSTKRPLPLNSRHLTAHIVRQLARGLGLPTAASGEGVRKLVEDPGNVQVLFRKERMATAG